MIKSSKSLHNFLRKTFLYLFSGMISAQMLFPFPGYASELPFMPKPGERVTASAKYKPVTLKGLRVYTDKPFQLSFMIDSGENLERGEALEQDAYSLIKYFLAALTVPSNSQWVNLSPFEPDRIIEKNFGKTTLGRDLLAQDYLLKQITASFLSPDDEQGQTFWNDLFQRIQLKYDTSDITLDMLTKVWIVPDKAVVYQSDHTGYIVDAHLKAMTEAEYLQANDPKSLSDHENASPWDLNSDPKACLTNETFENIILPEIEKEINQGEHFAALRQMYHAVILATWYKRTLEQSILSQKYANKNQINGINLKDLSAKNDIYNQYYSAYKNGAYNTIKEVYDPQERTIVYRNYFSGGSHLTEDTERILQVIQEDSALVVKPLVLSGLSSVYEATVNLNTLPPDQQDSQETKEDNALMAEARIPTEIKHQTIKSGEEAIFRITVEKPFADEIDPESLRLVTNLGGTWNIYKDALEFTSEDSEGAKTFEARVKITSNRNDTILYTFFYENKKTQEKEWVNIPGNDGSISVVVPFKGRTATISMEYGGPLAQKAGGEADVVYGKNKQSALLSDPSTPPIAVIPFFKENKKDSIVEKYNQFQWEEVPNFEYIFHFTNKEDIRLTAEKGMVEGVEIYRLVIDTDNFFQKLYNGWETEFFESIMLSRGGVALLDHLIRNENIKIDIIESNDHHTGLVLPLIRGQYAKTFENVGHSMLLHNISYQGQYWNIDWVKELELPEEFRDMVIRWNQINMLAFSAGMLGPKNRVVTVSPRYVIETLQAFTSLGFLVDRLLAQNPEYFIGLLNGLSENWNPATDRVLKKYEHLGFRNFDYTTISRKKENKRAFQKLLSKGASNEFVDKAYGRLEEGSDNMLMVSTNRLENQKQLDIVPYVIRRAREEKRKIDFVVIGDGVMEEEMIALAKEIEADPDSTVRFVYRAFSGDLEHLALGAADGCIAPSDFEPGGLAHLKGMLYGAVPFVRWTGGLADTVDETGPEPSGFGFSGISRTFSHKIESDQVRGVLGWTNWQNFIDEIDKELIKIEPRLGKFEATDLDLYEAIGRAFQSEGVLKMDRKEDKDTLFWNDWNGIQNGWAITHTDTVKKAVNERQFYRCIMRGLDAYENQDQKFTEIIATNSMKIKDDGKEKMQDYFKNVLAVNAMKIKAYWSDKIDAYYNLYQELKEAATPDQKAVTEVEFLTGRIKGITLDNKKGFIEIANASLLPDADTVMPLEKDAALATDKSVGGVDFNMNNIKIPTIGEVIEFSYRFKDESWDTLEINWLSPEIIDFHPVLNLTEWINP